VVSQTHQYLDDDPSGTPADNYTISLVLTDDDTGSNADSTTVTVNNVAPVLSGLAATAVSENGTATLSGNITDPGTLDSFTVVVDWGDGITETLNYGAGTAVFSQTHLYPDDDPSGTPADDYTITVTITDDDTGTASETAVVTVSNIAPDLFNIAATPLNIPENNTITITGQISDAGTLDTFTLVIDWADGVTATMNFPAGTTTFLATHVYQDDGLRMLLTDFDISLTLIDDDTGSDTETITVQVDNVPPTLDNILISDTINEGDTATLTGDIGEVSPADTFTLTVAWGDGNVDNYGYGAGTTAFNESHVYVDDDPTATPADVYTVTLTLVDDNGGTAVQVTTLTVNNVAPQLSSVVITPALDENGGATLTGSFTDPGVTDAFTLTIAWGDSSTDMVATFGSGNSFTATHQYLDDDPTGTPFDSYNVNLTLTDDDSGSGSDTTTLTVNNVAPVVDAGVDQSVAANISVSFSGTFSDVGTLDTHTIEWDFGDGSTALGTLAPNHTYTAQGVYIVTLTVTDDDTGISSDQLVITVIGGKLYLPFIAVSGGASPGPDLVVSTLAASGSSITVVVTNQGDTAVTDAFWVDVYIDPDPVPTMVNQTWPLLADEGMVWGVAGITLNPGQSLTLTNNGTHYRTDLSNFSGSLVVGTPIFAQVDSAHAATTYGNVWENQEISGGAYNNITQTTAQ
jgi:PKD repeat protein